MQIQTRARASSMVLLAPPAHLSHACGQMRHGDRLRDKDTGFLWLTHLPSKGAQVIRTPQVELEKQQVCVCLKNPLGALVASSLVSRFFSTLRAAGLPPWGALSHRNLGTSSTSQQLEPWGRTFGFVHPHGYESRTTKQPSWTHRSACWKALEGSLFIGLLYVVLAQTLSQSSNSGPVIFIKAVRQVLLP